MSRPLMLFVLLSTAALSITCSGPQRTEPVRCVPGCFNEWCPGTYDFCTQSQGACAPVACKRAEDCAGLGACDRSVRNSKEFRCEQGYCRRLNTTCLNECASDAQCGKDEFCFCNQGTCCWCDVHLCDVEADCNLLRQTYPESSFACQGGRCVVR